MRLFEAKTSLTVHTPAPASIFSPDDAQRRRCRARAVLSLMLLFVLALLSVAPAAVVAQASSASRSRTVREAPAAEATITLNEQFLNSFLDAMFTQLREPEFPLSIAHAETEGKAGADVQAAHAGEKSMQGACTNLIVLERERNGVRTAVRFEDGRIVAPLAFSGTYNAGLFGCLSFNGVASSVVTLEFDRSREAIMARVRVQDVELTGVPRLAGSVLINLVQTSIDKRFNPYELFKAEQLSTTVAVKAAGGSLRLRAREMRPEVIPGALRIRISYEFTRADAPSGAR